IVSKDPTVLLDTAHNQEGMQKLTSQLTSLMTSQKMEQMHLVIGMVSDKDSKAILAHLPKNGSYYFCRPSVMRGKPSEALRQEALAFGLHGNSYSTVKEAISAAKAA